MDKKENIKKEADRKTVVEHFYDSSRTLSTIVRNANYGLIGVVWILSHENVPELKNFFYPLLLIVLSLFCDLFQYLWKSITEGIFCHQYEKKDPRPDAYPKHISRGAWVFFILKTLLTLLGFILIFIQLFKNI